MANNKKPLEWQFQSITTVDATITNARIELGLKDDEVAEIHKIETIIVHANIPDAANDNVEGFLALSMDPDVDNSPAAAGSHEDLEWFYFDRSTIQIEVGAAGATVIERAHKKVDNYDPPVLVGTDVGMVVLGDVDILCEFWVRIFFTRRKANVMELNQVLLKRR